MRNERVNCFLQMADSLQSTCPKCSVLNKLPNRLDNIHCSAVEALTVAWDTAYDAIVADDRAKYIYPFIMADPAHADKVGSIRFFRWVSVLGPDIYQLSKSKVQLIKYLARGTVEERTCAAEMLHLYHSSDDAQCHISNTISMHREKHYLLNLYMLCLNLSIWPGDARLENFIEDIASDKEHIMHDAVMRDRATCSSYELTRESDCINLPLLQLTMPVC